MVRFRQVCVMVSAPKSDLAGIQVHEGASGPHLRAPPVRSAPRRSSETISCPRDDGAWCPPRGAPPAGPIGRAGGAKRINALFRWRSIARLYEGSLVTPKAQLRGVGPLRIRRFLSPERPVQLPATRV